MAGKYRRGTITSPAITQVVDIEWNENFSEDRRSADNAMTGDPIITKKEGSGSFTLAGGTMARIGNAPMTVVVEDVAFANNTETITNRTFVFTKVLTQNGLNANNDGGESSRKVSFKFGDVTES